ncbi:MAG: 30S ribosomal protein S13 [Candidatus Marsarchaeota archaeon]|jgi:small subunit ribosomal protein S13|nr:30S ribosomal protein S13 [Candidatus Marsarchaeota archaeon]
MAENKAQNKEEKKAQSIIRIAGRDIDGSLPIYRALFKIRGIGLNMANALTYSIGKKLSIQASAKLGELSEKQIEGIEEIIKKPAEYSVPRYMLNKRKDFDTGADVHYVGNDLTFSIRQDVNREVNLRTWKGYRHQYGQKVRGQHTRSTGRTGATIGVVKKSALKPPEPAASKPSK